MKKIAIVLLVLTVLVGSVFANGGKETSDAAEPILIGVSDAFSGDKASNGDYVREGVEMFLEHINAQGGVLGRKVDVVYVDDQGLETVATNAFQKLVLENDVCGVVLGKYSSLTLAVEPFIAEEKIPAISSGSNSKVAASTNPYLFSTRRSDNDSGKTMVAFIKENGAKRIAMLYAPDALGKGMSAVVRAGLEGTGIEIVSDQQFSEGEKQFATYVAKMKAANPDFIVIAAQSTETGLIYKAIYDGGLGDVPKIGSSASAQATTIEQAGKVAVENLYSITPFSPALLEEPTKSWVEEYVSKYGHNPEMASVTAYDSLMLFCDAIKRAGSADREAITNALKSLDTYEGIAATYGYQGTPMLAKSEVIIQIHDGQSVVVKKVVSE